MRTYQRTSSPRSAETSRHSRRDPLDRARCRKTLAAHNNANQPTLITTDGITWWQLHHTDNDAWTFVLHHATPDLFTTHDTDKPAWAERAIDIYLSITNQPQPRKEQP
jgi:hypothetical protein